MRWFFRSLHLIKDLKFFLAVLIFTGIGQDLTHFAHKENTRSQNFSVRQTKNVNCICSLTALT
jgi:hypothetical protein